MVACGRLGDAPARRGDLLREAAAHVLGRGRVHRGPRPERMVRAGRPGTLRRRGDPPDLRRRPAALRGRDAGFGPPWSWAPRFCTWRLATSPILDMAVSVLMSGTLFCFILGWEPPGRARGWLFYGLYAERGAGDPDQGTDRLSPDRGGDVPLAPALRPVEAAPAVASPDAAASSSSRSPRPGTVLVSGGIPPGRTSISSTSTGSGSRRRSTAGTGPGGTSFPSCFWGSFRGSASSGRRFATPLAGGWARRRENAEAWFLVVWAGFIFLFFSKSQSKLIPYILPVFPAARRSDRALARGGPGIGRRGRRWCGPACGFPVPLRARWRRRSGRRASSRG